MGEVRGDAESIRTEVERLRKKLRRNAREAHDVLTRTSTVPLEALDVNDPMLEAALTDSAMQFFLRHMTGFEDDQVEEAGFNPRSEAIPSAELDATLRRVAALEFGPPPDLTADLDRERLWILIDLLVHGDPLSQHRATVEIRDAMTRVDELPPATVADLRTALRAMPGRPLLLDLLLHSVEIRAELAHSGN
jgi:hypothetical protein